MKNLNSDRWLIVKYGADVRGAEAGDLVLLLKEFGNGNHLLTITSAGINEKVIIHKFSVSTY